ncbi:MAG: hypothetical protein NXY57DRAFT_407827 [Lentinula lateritia]|uniref:Secreted protein n=1 Tax=Lentinula lateritia TaxID=40482 RepID=A0ABQ8VC99_9AGAR|nr:MAG: hypothetical protein NXY57DRAFT_407827 [Lentinula lateritia]KAJ4480797.1 hypothetical protein C8R41DRAFT_492863 [Lentinula lateritia]
MPQWMALILYISIVVPRSAFEKSQVNSGGGAFIEGKHFSIWSCLVWNGWSRTSMTIPNLSVLLAPADAGMTKASIIPGLATQQQMTFLPWFLKTSHTGTPGTCL